MERMETSTSVLSIKAKGPDGWRRFSISSSEAFVKLEEVLSELFKIREGSVHVEYLDEDDDWITMSSDGEMRDAMNHMRDGVLRLRVVDTSMEKRTKAQVPETPPEPLARLDDNEDASSGPADVAQVEPPGWLPAVTLLLQNRAFQDRLVHAVSSFIGLHHDLIAPLVRALHGETLDVQDDSSRDQQFDSDEGGSASDGPLRLLPQWLQGRTGLGGGSGRGSRWDSPRGSSRRIGTPHNVHGGSFSQCCPINMFHSGRGEEVTPSGRKSLVARFVKDLTVPDGTHMTRGSPFVKQWRIRNDGDAEWPKGTRLVYVGGDLLGASERIIPLAKPGETVDVELELTSPELPGRYVCYFRLCTSAGDRFGQRIWADFYVD